MLEDAPLSTRLRRDRRALLRATCCARTGVELVLRRRARALRGRRRAGRARRLRVRARRSTADAVVMGTGAVPDVMLARSAGLELGETRRRALRRRAARPPRPASGRRATCASTTPSCTAGGCGSSTGRSRGPRARTPRPAMLGARRAVRRGARTSGRTSPTGARSSTSARREAWDARGRARLAGRRRVHGLLLDGGRLVGARSPWAAPEDLTHARRLLAAARELAGREAALRPGAGARTPRPPCRAGRLRHERLDARPVSSSTAATGSPSWSGTSCDLAHGVGALELDQRALTVVNTSRRTVTIRLSNA